MKLLTVEQRERRFKYLGLGKYNKKNILKFQKKAFPNKKDEWDSEYGVHTDRALRTFYNVKRYGEGYFEPEEFRCNCGHCCGYPTYMKKVEIEHIVRIRKHYKKPMTITSGLRCDWENSHVGGVKNSGHLKGYAVDMRIAGVTDTVKERKETLKWLMKQPNHQFSYGAYMVGSDDVYREAAGMGNAMHTETHKPEETVFDKMCKFAKKIADSAKYIYVFYNSKYGKECAICHPHGGKNKGWQCIGYDAACWHHGGELDSRCKCDVFTDPIYEQMLYNMTSAQALKKAQQRLGIKELKIIRNKNGIDPSKIQPGDWLVFFKGKKYMHSGLGVRAGRITDCTSSRTPNIKYDAPCYTKWTLKMIIRYTGK